MERSRFYDCLARIGKIVESPERIRIVDALCQADRSVEALSRETGLPVRTVSHHLQKLKKDCFVVSEKQGRFVIYSIAGNEIATFLDQMKQLSELIFPELTLSLQKMRAERASLDESLLPANSILIDVRPAEEFNKAHIPGAVCIPFKHFEKNIKNIPEGTSVIAYCRDKYCDIADKAVKILKDKGFNAWRLEDSVSARMATEKPLVKEKE